MKLINKLSPKRLFRSSKKDRSIVSKFDPSSYSSGSATSSSSSESVSSVHKSSAAAGLATPTSVLPESSGDLSDFSANFYLELCEAFKTIDKDNDGFITRTELEALLSKFTRQPPSREEISSMLSDVDDGGGDGCISLETLMSRVAGAACDEPACEPELRETFDIFDTDHDGKITAEELMAFYEKIGDERCTLEDCRLMIASVDKNGDGFVCFEDFSRMMELQR